MNPSTTILDPEGQLARRMADVGIREEDLEETFVRSGGHGGQNVNKTSTCVVLLHRPTGVQVKCQTTRSQKQNRILARELLVTRLETAQREKAAAERSRREKLRRQSRKRSRQAQIRILEDKARRATRKAFRRKVELD